jgi:hypothetical protein
MPIDAMQRELARTQRAEAQLRKAAIRKKDVGRRCHFRGRDLQAIRPAGNQNQHACNTVPDDKRVASRRSDRCFDRAEELETTREWAGSHPDLVSGQRPPQETSTGVVPNHAAQIILRSTTTLEAIRPFQEASVSEITRPFGAVPELSAAAESALAGCGSEPHPPSFTALHE